MAWVQGDPAAARRIAEANLAHPIERWRLRFAELAAQLDEAEGRPATREAALVALRPLAERATREPVLRVERVAHDGLRVSAANLARCRLRWHAVDLETLFSRSPFVERGDADALALAEPARTQAVDIGADGTADVAVPLAWRRRSAVVVADGDGARHALLTASDDLDLRISAANGFTEVRSRTTGAPIPSAYVKIYRETDDGPVFHKDGYTDRRGRFDHVALEGSRLPAMKRLAILVEAGDAGSAVRIVEPPAE